MSRKSEPSTEPDLRATVRQLDALADMVVDRLVVRLIAGLQGDGHDVGAERRTPLPDDAVVHQDTAPMDRHLYLRMARRQEFGSFREGKKVFAFWGAVRRALDARMTKSPVSTTPTADDTPDLCRQLGVVPRKKN